MTSLTQHQSQKAAYPSTGFPKVFFIDDNRANNFLIQSYIDLDNIPINPYFERSAIRALDYFKQLPSSEFPQYIFVDINMPLMNGFEFVQAFMTTFPTQCQQTKIYILSSSIHPADKKRVHGFSAIKGYLEKPLDVKFLQKIAGEILC